MVPATNADSSRALNTQTFVVVLSTNRHLRLSSCSRHWPFSLAPSRWPRPSLLDSSLSRITATPTSGSPLPLAPMVFVRPAALLELLATLVSDHLHSERSVQKLNVSCVASANGICYWTNPTPGNGNYRIPKGGKNTGAFPYGLLLDTLRSD